MTVNATTPAPQVDDTSVSPCGCPGCEKWADCAYCGTCTAQDPWAAADNEAREDALWARQHEGGFADWLASRAR